MSLSCASRFSPDGKYLAAGSQQGTVDIYDISHGSALHRVGYCRDMSGFVMHLDFSADSTFIRVCIFYSHKTPQSSNRQNFENVAAVI